MHRSNIKPVMESETSSQRHHEEVTWNFVCSMPLAHLTFILKYFMSDMNPFVSQSEELTQVKESRKITEELSRKAGVQVLYIIGCPTVYKRRQETKQSSTKPEVVIKETDLMLAPVGVQIGNNGKECQYHIDTTDTLPGYLRIVKNDQGAYLSKQDIRYLFNVNSVDWPSYVVMLKSLFCPIWPTQAEEWTTRHRSAQWPPKTLIDDITKTGCHVIQAAHGSSQHPDIEWEFTFALAEQKLMQSLTNVQRQCYFTLEMIILWELSPPYLLTQSCLRGHFFWCMEKIPAETWNDDVNGLGEAFEYVVSQLLYALIEGRMPDYFIRPKNWIDQIPEDFLHELMAKVSDLHKDPVKYLLRFDSRYHFSHTLSKANMKTLLRPVLDDCTNYHNSVNRCYAVQAQSAQNICKAFLQEENFAAAHASSITASRLDKHLGKKQTPAALMEKYLCDCDDPEKVMNGLEYILNNFVDVSETLYDNMACLYTSLYCSSQNESKEYYGKRADDLYQKSFEESGFQPLVAVHYSLYLQRCGRAAEAIPLLTKAHHREQPRRYHHNKKLLRKDCYDEHLQTEFERLDKVSPLVMIFYQLIQCYIGTDKKDEAKEVMMDLSATCCRNGETSPLNYLLVGYANLDLNEFVAAKCAFEQAHTLNPEDYLAKNNIDLCEALIMSLEQ